jgi:hypothetical protein
MTVKPPDKIGARASQALRRYLDWHDPKRAFYETAQDENDPYVPYLSMKDFEDLVPVEFALLIESLGQCWRDWKGKSPRTRDPYADVEFPFADWVRSLFNDVGEKPPPPHRIRMALQNSKTLRSRLRPHSKH